MTDFYLRLDYEKYKSLENQLRNFKKLETTHTTVEGFYHKSFRLKIGEINFEFYGPLVKKPA